MDDKLEGDGSEYQGEGQLEPVLRQVRMYGECRKGQKCDEALQEKRHNKRHLPMVKYTKSTVD